MAMGPTDTTTAIGGNAVDTLAQNRKGVVQDVPFGANNKKVIQAFYLISDAASLDTVTSTTFQRLYQWNLFNANPAESYYA